MSDKGEPSMTAEKNDSAESPGGPAASANATVPPAPLAENGPLAGDSVKAISLWQPWASLVELGVKTIETRSWSTRYRGPLAIHAAKRMPPHWWHRWDGEPTAKGGAPWHDALERYCHMDEANDGWCRHSWCGPLGDVVATCTLVDVVPMVHTGEEGAIRTLDIDGDGALWVVEPYDDEDAELDQREVTNQRPYGDFSPGRYAWLLDDIKPLPEPIPARGRQQMWNWTPSAASHKDGDG